MFPFHLEKYGNYLMTIHVSALLALLFIFAWAYFRHVDYVINADVP